MTKCEKCKCEFDELEMIILPMDPDDTLNFLCLECYDLVMKDVENELTKDKIP